MIIKYTRVHMQVMYVLEDSSLISQSHLLKDGEYNVSHRYAAKSNSISPRQFIATPSH